MRVDVPDAWRAIEIDAPVTDAISVDEELVRPIAGDPGRAEIDTGGRGAETF